MSLTDKTDMQFWNTATFFLQAEERIYFSSVETGATILFRPAGVRNISGTNGYRRLHTSSLSSTEMILRSLANARRSKGLAFFSSSFSFFSF